MNRHLLNILIAIILLFTSCQTEKQSDKHINLEDKPVAIRVDNTNGLSTFDTTIVLTGVVKSSYRGLDLNDEIAKAVLYNYFTNKGYLTSDNLPNAAKLTKKDEEKLSVDFTSIFKVDINNNKFIDAVITYWLTPPYASGHCWQPHKAIISDTDSGYQITNEEFIPANYAIDSVLTVKGQTTIYGYDYECANHKTLKNIRVRITK